MDTLDNIYDMGKLGQGFMSTDELEEVDIGDGTKARPAFVSKRSSQDLKMKVIELLKEYQDFFAWEYHEMPGLSRSILEHWLSIKPGYRPYKKPSRRFDPKIHESIKEEICNEADFLSLI